MELISRKLQILTYLSNWLYFTQCLTSFSSIKYLIRLCATFLILFHLTQMRLSRSTHLLMFLSLETLTSIIRTGLPILVELIDLVNSVIISNDLTQMVNFPTWIPDCNSHSPTLLDLFISPDFWIDLFLLMLVFVLQWLPSIGKFRQCCCLSYH